MLKLKDSSFIQRCEELMLIHNYLILKSLMLTHDHDMAELLRGFKYTAIASTAFAGDSRGLLEKKVLAEPHMRCFLMSYLTSEIFSAAVLCKSHREKVFSSEV